VAGANYEVNIQLKADPALKSLERIEQKINKLTKTSVDLQDARGAAMVKNRNLADRINKLEEKGVKVAKMRERLGKAIEKTDKGSLQTAAAHEKILRREVKNEERLLQVKKDQLKVDRQQNRQKGPGRAQQAILGGGFPLLFGGSPFQAAAGAIGGAAGGFAGGIGLQVLAGQIENVLGRAAQLGQGLNDLTFDLDGVVTAAGFANTETAQLLERIEQYGDAAVAARLATELLEKRIGVEGVQALKDFGKQAGELGSALSTIFSQVLASIAQAAGPLLSSLAKFAGQQADIGAFRARTGLTGQEKLAQDILNAGGIGGAGGASGMRSGRSVLLESFRSRAQGLGMGDMSAQQLQKFALQTATQSQRAFELPTLKAIEFEASQVQDPSQRAAGRRGRSKAERQQLKEFLELNKQMTLELDRQDELNRMAGEHIAKQLNDADKVSSNQEKRRAKLEGIINGTEREVELRQAIKNITERGLLPADEKRLIAAEKQIYAMEKQAEDAKKLEGLYKRVGSAIESGIVNGIMSAIDGTKSLQESLAAILKDVGSILLQFAVRTGLNAINPTMFPMAEGGYVSGPTPALIGEGGESEYVIPESKMRESMARYSRGARGSSVIPETGASGTSGEGGGAAVAAPIDVRYTVERINSVDYVTADQFQTGMRQAANQGAKQGEQQTLKRLQMSGGTRKRLGM
jgi:hypothetical protein